MLKMSLWLREISSPTLNIPATNDRSYKIMFETLSCDIFIFAVLLSAILLGFWQFWLCSRQSQLNLSRSNAETYQRKGE